MDIKKDIIFSSTLTIKHPITGEAWTGINPGDFDYLTYRGAIPAGLTLSFSEIPLLGKYVWAFTPDIINPLHIEISLNIFDLLDLQLPPYRWQFNFNVVEHDLEDVYDKIDSLAAGEGSEPVIIYAKETGSELPIPEADYEIWDESNSVRLHSGEDSDNNGNQEFNLNPGNYKVKLRKPYWNFPIVTDLTVPVGGTDLTIHGERLLPSVPSDPNLCVVYGYLYGVDGQKLPGANIVAELNDLSAFKNSIKIAEMTNEAVSNEEGYFELELIPNSKLEPEGSLYSFKITKNGIYLWTVRAEVPDQASAQFRDIINLSEIDC